MVKIENCHCNGCGIGIGKGHEEETPTKLINRYSFCSGCSSTLDSYHGIPLYNLQKDGHGDGSRHYNNMLIVEDGILRIVEIIFPRDWEKWVEQRKKTL